MLLCIEAWEDLHSCRPVGFAGAGLIPWTAIVEWCRFRELDRDVMQMLVMVLRKLDYDRAEREASKERTP